VSIGILGLDEDFVQMNEIMGFYKILNCCKYVLVIYSIFDRNRILKCFLIENLFLGSRVLYMQSRFPSEKNLFRHNTVVVVFIILPSVSIQIEENCYKIIVLYFLSVGVAGVLIIIGFN
jgi:hypothetical protein